MLADGVFDGADEMQAEIDQMYAADMADPDNGISGVLALRIWNSLPMQLLRASVKKILADRQFGSVMVAKADVELRNLPPYAAHYIGDGCVKS